MKTKNIILSSITAIALTVPAIADPVVPNIAPNAESADCTQPVLGTTTGTSNLQASWTANTLNLKWFDGEQEITPNNNDAKTCTYDSGITIPSNTMSKTGYTFAGWTVKSSQCNTNIAEYMDENGYDIYESVDWDSTHTRWKPISIDGNTMINEFGEENSSDLNNGEWAVTFSYGTVKGEALCSSTNGEYATTGTPNETGGGRYCWCKAKTFAPIENETEGSSCNVAPSSWVFFNDFLGANDCPLSCASDCAEQLQHHEDIRVTIFGITE